MKRRTGGGFRNVGKRRQIESVLLLSLIPGVWLASGQNCPAWKRGAGSGKAPDAGLACRRIELKGEAIAGREWSAAIGEGWVFRLVPVAPSGKGYTGWDLAVSPAGDEDYPDALLLATPPYGSLNAREVATTFGLRAQDAIAWQPRQFRFLASRRDIALGRELYRSLMGTGPASRDGAGFAARQRAADQLLAMAGGGARLGAGEFTVLNAKLIEGAGDPPPFAREWAGRASQTPFTVLENEGTPTAQGALQSIRFSAAFRLPPGWGIKDGLPFTKTKCAE